jgi:hypothetical protein
MASMLDKLQESEFELKIKSNGYYHKLNVRVNGSKLQLYFPYNKDLLEEVKTNFEGRVFVPKDKGGPRWDIPITYRNIFRLEVLQGKYSDANVYGQFENVEKYDLSEIIAPRFEAKGAKKYKHSIQMVNQGIVGRWFVWAAHMGTGKTLASIITMEMIREKYGWNDIIWVGPKSPLVAVKAEFRHWKSSLQPEFMTYDGMRSLVEKWPSGKAPPRMIIFDEASKLKTPTSKRSQAAKYLTDKMREAYGFDCIIGLLSGTPAPKSPSDWWMLCEIGCPGFIREGHINAFRQRLAIIEKRETIPGAGQYDHIVSWRDDDKKCSRCGMPKEHANHQSDGMARFLANLGTEAVSGGQTQEVHDFIAGTNEVAKLKHRMRGLVGVWLKEDCLDLPPKRYEVISVKPSRATLNAAKIITQSSGRAIEALTLLRELSDGFQYVTVRTGKVIDCTVCGGSGKVKEFFNPANPSLSFSEEEIREGIRFIYEEDDYGESRVVGKEKIEIVESIVDCNSCGGHGKVDETKRDISEVECPKDQVLIDKLEMHEECERFNIYGGFTGTIDRIVKINARQGWGSIRADGRGWMGFNANGSPIIHPNGDKFTSDQLYALYRGTWSEEYTAGPLAFVGQPGAAGMGLTLTVSPSTFFFSNDFNGENREQAEDRGHRIGMDVVRGGLITDVIHLPSDLQVLDNLRKKKQLQYMAMKGLAMALESVEL